MRAARFAVFAVCLASAGALADAASAQPFPPVGRLSILAVEGPFGWSLEVELEGSNAVTSAQLGFPGGRSIDLGCAATGPSASRCDFVDPVAPDPFYESLEALLVAYPPGEWTLAVDGPLTATVTFDPVEPDALPVIVAPASGATGVSSTPSVSYTHQCSNCVALFVEIADLTSPLSVEALVFGEPFGTPPASPGEVLFEQLFSIDGPTPEELPGGDYEVQVGALAGALAIETFGEGTPSQTTFQYGSGAQRAARSTFSVPGPHGALAAALGALACRARRRG